MFEALSSIPSFLFNGFAVTTLLMLPIYVLLPTARPMVNRLGLCSNNYLLFGACLLLLLVTKQLLLLVEPVGTEDEEARYILLNKISGPYWFSYWGALLLNGISPQLLWRRGLRKQFQTSAVLAGLLVAAFFLPNLIASNYDYLPSSWATIQLNYLSLALASVPYGALVGMTYLFANRLRCIDS